MTYAAYFLLKHQLSIWTKFPDIFQISSKHLPNSLQPSDNHLPPSSKYLSGVFQISSNHLPNIFQIYSKYLRRIFQISFHHLPNIFADTPHLSTDICTHSTSIDACMAHAWRMHGACTLHIWFEAFALHVACCMLHVACCMLHVAGRRQFRRCLSIVRNSSSGSLWEYGP